MKKWICYFLCLPMILGLLAGCGFDPARILPKGGNGLNKGKPNIAGINMSYDKNKIDEDIVSGNTDFAFDIFKELNKEDKDENIFISPFSISSALAMTYQGAGGLTKDAMAKGLRYSGTDIETLNESYQNLVGHFLNLDKKIELNISNSLWVRDGLPVNEDFVSINRDKFNALVETLDFSQADAADKINGWISEATKDKIKNMIDPPIQPSVMMYLINAIYFKGEWTEKFNKDVTIITQFHKEDGNTQDIMMMNRNDSVEYGQGDDFQVVRLPYGGGDTAMYCILPDKADSINDFIDSMDSTKWDTIKNSVVEEEILLQIPRFEMEYGIKQLNDSLISLGMGEAFSQGADFSGMLDESYAGAGLYIDRVLHKAVIDVNEEGSEAAAATVVEMKEAAAIMDPIEFIADRPFLFIIADDETGSILFMGKAYDL